MCVSILASSLLFREESNSPGRGYLIAPQRRAFFSDSVVLEPLY
jgi:hypothetical protein